jgi:hypothetical protein
LVERNPAEAEYALTLASLEVNWSYLLWGTGQPDAALTRNDEAVKLTEAVLRQEPQHAGAHYFAYSAHGARAQCHEVLGRWADAVKDWDRVVELDSKPDPWFNRVMRVKALTRAGEHARVAAEAQALGANKEVNPIGMLDLVRSVVRSSEAVRSDKRLTPAEREATARRYADQAIGLLRLLEDRGYFTQPARVARLITDPDLEALHKRIDFWLIVVGSQKPKKV